METVAKYIQSGDNVANILNALKWDGESKTLSLYSTNNEEYKSSVELPIYDNRDAVEVERPVRGMYNIGYLISDDDRLSDCTTKVQHYIDLCAEDGGGVIRFGTGVYKISTLTIPNSVSLVGNGPGNTILYRVINGHTEGETEIVYNSKGFIYIPAGARGITIKDMTLYGGVVLENTKDEDYQVSGRTTYTDSKIATGIYVASCPMAETNEGLAIQPYSIHTGSGLNYSTPYKYITLDNLAIIGFSGSGIFIGANASNIAISNVTSNINRYAGLVSAGSHTQISNFIANGNGDNGILHAGVYNKYSNIECSYNGKYNHLNAAGFFVDSNDVIVSNLECRFSYSRGVVIDGDRCQFVNVICDANGSRDSYDESDDQPANNNPRDVDQIVLSGNHITFRGSVCNYRAGETIKVSRKPVEATNLANSIVELSVLRDSAEYNCTVNGTDIAENLINNTDLITNGVLTIILI